MKALLVSKSKPLSGTLRPPGDKSISHRALLLGAIADGDSFIHGFLPCNDCLATLSCIEALGVNVQRRDDTSLVIRGAGLRGLSPPQDSLNCAKAGTAMRLLVGMLAGQGFESTLTGDQQLLHRPMQRVIEPLSRMGAIIKSTLGHAPLVVKGNLLHGIRYKMPIASAQVKSAILLAGLYASGPTTICQPSPSRDHTERMLLSMKARIKIEGQSIEINPSKLQPLSVHIPADFSSAAFPMVAASLVPGSSITLEAVGINPTRTGLLDVLSSMGASITANNPRVAGNEPVADLVVQSSSLHGVEVSSQMVSRMIDEFPILAVAATQANGTTRITDASELRVKETDRISTVVGQLTRLGASIDPTEDGFVVQGPTPLKGTAVSSHGDHRLAMALSVAGMIAQGSTQIDDIDCVDDSFPGFIRLMKELGASYD
jgi:3-phosphoshikimate 1-carboxyvinyltransferase